MHSKPTKFALRFLIAGFLLFCAQEIARGSGSQAKDGGGVSVSSAVRVGSGHGQAGPPGQKTLP